MAELAALVSYVFYILSLLSTVSIHVREGEFITTQLAIVDGCRALVVPTDVFAQTPPT